MKQCIACSSYAINPKTHGRTPGRDEDICDVCYWRVQVDIPYSLAVKNLRDQMKAQRKKERFWW